MASMNCVILMGNITRDPELRYTPGGQAVSTLGLAINSKSTKNGEKHEEVTFIDVTVWEKLAENCVKYLSKGSPILIEGRLKLNTWEKNGEKRSKLNVTAHNVQFLGVKPKEEAPPLINESDFSDDDVPF